MTSNSLLTHRSVEPTVDRVVLLNPQGSKKCNGVLVNPPPEVQKI